MTAHSVETYETVDAVNENQWNNLVSQSDLGSIFHRHEWLDLVESALARTARHVVAEKDGNPVGLLPNFRSPIYVPGWQDLVKSLPVHELESVSPGYGGPIVGGDETEVLEAMLDHVDSLGGLGTLYHKLRTNDLGYVRYGKTLARHGYEPVGVNCRFRIHLDRSWEDIKADMGSERRRILRKMDDRDVEIRDEPLEEATLEKTYDAYVRNVTRSGGTPYPYDFFTGLVDRLGDRVKVFTAVVDGREVGHYLYLLDEEQSTLHHYFAAVADEEYFADNPSEVLHAHGIQWGQEEGYRFYDFGGTGADYRDGVFRHKERYGGEAVPTLQWQKGLSRVGWPAFRTARSLYRKRAY